MTYETNCTVPEAFLEQIAQQWTDLPLHIIRKGINVAMQIERQYHLNADPFERIKARPGLPAEVDHGKGRCDHFGCATSS